MERVGRRTAWGAIWLLIAVVMVFAAIRLTQDVPAILSGELPAAGTFERRYAEHPVRAYAHILPGVAYLLIAPLQVSRRFRTRDLPRHRRLGRVALTAGLITGVFGVVVGLSFPYGGAVEGAASLVFGTWFVAALTLAFRAIRRGDESAHRRWMIRAFAIGLGVGTIRLVVGAAEFIGLGFRQAFGPAFWIAFSLHAVAGELWLWRNPRRPR